MGRNIKEQGEMTVYGPDWRAVLRPTNRAALDILGNQEIIGFWARDEIEKELKAARRAGMQPSTYVVKCACGNCAYFDVQWIFGDDGLDNEDCGEPGCGSGCCRGKGQDSCGGKCHKEPVKQVKKGQGTRCRHHNCTEDMSWEDPDDVGDGLSWCWKHRPKGGEK